VFLPIGDEPNPSEHLPLVTIGLIAINVAIFLLLALPLGARAPDPNDPVLADYLRAIVPQLPAGTSVQAVLQRVTAYDLLLFRWGFRASAPSLTTLLTGMFLHGGLLHVAGNMLYLWVYGNNVEDRLGRVGFLFWYAAQPQLADPFGGCVGRHLRRPRVLSDLVSAQRGQGVRVPVSFLYRRCTRERDADADSFPHPGQPPSAPHQSRSVRHRLQCTYRRLFSRSGSGVADAAQRRAKFRVMCRVSNPVQSFTAREGR